MRTHSLQRRSLYKLTANVTGAAVGLASQAIVPRALGPAAYGDYSYATSFFWQMVAFLNLNSSTAFYVKLSQRPGERGLVRFYFGLICGIAALLAFGVGASWLSGWDGTLWPGLARATVLFGAVWAMLSFLGMVLADMADALGLTVHSERMKLFAKTAGLAVLFLMFKTGRLCLESYFIQQVCLLFLVGAGLAIVIYRGRPPAADPKPMRVYAREFKAFCLPLVLFTLVSIIEQMFDRWLIQNVSGSRNQGLYALSIQIGGFCFLLTSSIVPLLLRENAKAYHAQDFDRLRRLFSRSVNVLFVLSAALCVFFAAHARTIVLLFGGRAFQEAHVPFVLMVLFPIHQTLGQLNGNLFFASERMRPYRNIGLATAAVGLPLSVLLLGPASYRGLELGAAGLATKMVLVQMVSVNVQLFVNARFLEISFLPFLKTQGVVLSVLTALSLGTEYLGKALTHVAAVQLGFAALLYGTAVLTVVYARPSLLSLESNDFSRLWAGSWGKIYGGARA